ncbi:MAG: hypothetical protein KGQ58_01125 [Proteobacteria bacterium]|nr:hypothetical protein [Pseudomonadota bacterium]
MSESKIIPKETLSAYERWEMAAMDAPAAGSPVSLTTANEVEHIQELARQEGYAAGMNEVNEKAKQLGLLLAELNEARSKWVEEIETDVFNVVLALCKQFLRCALSAKPELVCGVIKEVMGSLPWLEMPPRLFLHPEDARLVRSVLAEEIREGKWQILEDAAIRRGGLRIETVQNTVDATIEGRWKQLLAAFDEPGAWEE